MSLPGSPATQQQQQPVQQAPQQQQPQQQQQQQPQQQASPVQPQQQPPPQQQAPTTPSSSAPVVSSPAALVSAGNGSKCDELTCQWTGCSEKFDTAEDLYNHLCDIHVGRKSTNNLCLTCAWSACRTTTVKRDHITSHIRVHVPLKPHKCEFCAKAFKRPQDLKKHVKRRHVEQTHADDSVLMRSPEPDGTGRRHAGVAGNLHAQYTTGVGMQPLAATAAQAYYGILHHGAMSGMHSHAAAGLGNYYPNNAQTNAGSVYYYPHAPQDGQQASAIAHAAQAVAAQAQAAQQAQAQAQQQQENSKKRSFEGVDQFFEDAKRHKLQPIYDGAMAQRLSALQFIPSSTSEGVDFNGAATVTAPATNGSTQTFTLPSLRTKQDLIDADNFLTQLSANVYDNSQQYQYRTNTSASPHTPNGQSHQGQDGQHDGAASASMANPVTQALTPPGSNYTTSHSPVHHSHAHTPPNVSPQSSAASMYPSLPATVSSAGVTGGYPAPVSSAPTSSLASAFEAGERRRYPVGVLQKAKPAETPADVDMGEFSEDTKQEVSDAMIDPSLDALVVDDKSAHCELINSLRAYIQELLRAEEKREKEGGDLIVADEALAQPEDGDHAMTDAPSAPATEAEDASSNSANDGQHQEAQTENTEENKQSEHQTDAQALYPILKAVAAC